MQEGYSTTVLQSAQGWYVGEIFTNPEGVQEVCGRQSDYFATQDEAKAVLMQKGGTHELF